MHQPPLMHLGAGEGQLAEEERLRAAEADEPRQQVGRAPGRDEASFEVRREQLRRLGRDAHVTRQRHADSTAGDDAVDGGDDRLSHRQHRADRVVQLVGQLVEQVARARHVLAHLVDVAAAREGAAGAGQQQAAHRRVGRRCFDRVADVGCHCESKCVQLRGPVESDNPHCALIADVDRHAPAPVRGVKKGAGFPNR